MRIAQTNLQLYNQLLSQRRAAEELKNVRLAYELAMQLFASRFRATGKPFLAHLVGTASLLAWFEQPASVVMAGLLHAAFDAGDFADGRTGFNRSRQHRMERLVGDEVSSLVIEYHRLPRSDVIKCLQGCAPIEMNSMRSTVLLIHLCDTLEEHSDSGMRYAPGKNESLIKSCGPDIATSTIEAFSRLGFEAYRPELCSMFLAWQECSLPPELISNYRGSYLLPPLSYRERSSVKLMRLWNRSKSKLDRTLTRFRQRMLPIPWMTRS
ncbi:MAG: HD domain-containing protein [Pirellulaceae bacterium]|nr:HD domain-containing protein [Pirellulaceae bacterium]